MPVSWYKSAFGVAKEPKNGVTVRKQVRLETKGWKLRPQKKKSGFVYCGKFELLSLKKLRTLVAQKTPDGDLTLSGEVDDSNGGVAKLMKDNSGAVFQVESLFNMLQDTANTKNTELRGVTIENRGTNRGPEFSRACAAGTLYRKHFVRIKGKRGQTKDRQLNGLEGVLSYLGVDDPSRFMVDGYYIPDKKEITAVNNKLNSLTLEEKEECRAMFRVGVQRDTAVTANRDGPNSSRVTQVFCPGTAAVPVSNYLAPDEKRLYKSLKKLILEASYEAALLVGILNSNSDSNELYLSLIVGHEDSYSLDMGYIKSVLESLCVDKYRRHDLQVKVYYKSGTDVNSLYLALIEEDVSNSVGSGDVGGGEDVVGILDYEDGDDPDTEIVTNHTMTNKEAKKQYPAIIHMISGCQDDQTSSVSALGLRITECCNTAANSSYTK